MMTLYSHSSVSTSLMITVWSYSGTSIKLEVISKSPRKVFAWKCKHTCEWFFFRRNIAYYDIFYMDYNRDWCCKYNGCAVNARINNLVQTRTRCPKKSGKKTEKIQAHPSENVGKKWRKYALKKILVFSALGTYPRATRTEMSESLRARSDNWNPLRF